MFGLFKKKATEEEFKAAKSDGSVYPGESITVMQIQTESGGFGTAWINKKYKDFKFKEYCPFLFILKIDLSNITDEQRDILDMSTIEDFFDERMKEIGVSHFIARFVTDKGMDMIFYTEANPEFEEVLNSLKSKNELGLEFEIDLNKSDLGWKSMKMVLK